MLLVHLPTARVTCARPAREGCSVHSIDAAGNTALHTAARTGAHDCVVVLLCHGADTHAVNINGETPAELAAAHDDPA